MSGKFSTFSLYAFALFSLVNLLGEYHKTSWLIFISKPLLLSLLTIYFYVNTLDRPHPFRKWILAGLLFSIAGDTLLMFVENPPFLHHFFLLGLGSFLFTHIFYLMAFLGLPGTKNGAVKNHPLIIFPFLAFLAANTIFLWPDLPVDMKGPVVFYSVAIITMAIGATNLYGLIPGNVFRILITGVLLFIFSDSLIAINKFKMHQPSLWQMRLLIMSSYLIGQYLIVQASVKTLKTIPV